ncbi:hypothetical protein C8R44DRAFT_890004 [Mycena epipterygia]|nr:hypothetical protein C8R44DRAFT_890004 [Mycena epipterygia]
MSTTTPSFTPPPGHELKWRKVHLRSNQFLGLSKADIDVRIDSMDETAAAWAPFLTPEMIPLVSKSEGFVTLFSSVENKFKQWADLLATDPEVKDLALPNSLAEFLTGAERFRAARKSATVPTGAALKAIVTRSATMAEKPSSSGKRARSNSIGPSDIESEVFDDADEDVVMADVPRPKAKAREALAPPIEIISDAETDTEVKSAPAKKKASTTRSQKKSATSEATTSQKGHTDGQQQNELDFLTYEEMKANVEHSYRIGVVSQSIPTSSDGLRRMDCVLRTQLAQTSIIISIEARKYDVIFLEYECVRRAMEDRKVPPTDYLPITYEPHSFQSTLLTLISISEPIDYPLVRAVNIPSGPRATHHRSSRGNGGPSYGGRGRGRA